MRPVKFLGTGFLASGLIKLKSLSMQECLSITKTKNTFYHHGVGDENDKI